MTQVRKAAVTGNEFGSDRRGVVVEGTAFEFNTQAQVILVKRDGRVSRPPRPDWLEGGTDASRRREISEQIGRAGLTLRNTAMPAEYWCLLGAMMKWPDVVPSAAERVELERDLEAARAVGLRKAGRTRPAAPSGKALDDLDDVLWWILWLEPEARFVVVRKMMGLGARRIARIDPLRRSKSVIDRVYRAGLDNILSRLSAASTTS